MIAWLKKVFRPPTQEEMAEAVERDNEFWDRTARENTWW